MPLHFILRWQPFRIDALGLVTMIGSEQINASIGRLVTSRFTHYLPLLGAFVIAGDQFTEALSGFTLYNITYQIITTDTAGWFQRWCLAQNFSKSGSQVTFHYIPPTSPEGAHIHSRRRRSTCLAILIGLLFNSALVAFTILQGDWWGLANAIAMILSIFVRVFVVSQNRAGLDAAADANQSQTSGQTQQAKLLVILNDAKAVTMTAPAGLVKPCFIFKPQPPNESLYEFARNIGWLAFTAHVISIGMSGLATQIVTVVLIVLPTVLTVRKWGCDNDEIIGTRLRATVTLNHDESARRQDAYVALRLTEEEDDSMVDWNLMPHRTNRLWWNEYKAKKEGLRSTVAAAATGGGEGSEKGENSAVASVTSLSSGGSGVVV